MTFSDRAPLALLLLLVFLSGCRSAYYSAWEQLGVYKRDLLKRSVVAAREDQKKASEQFKDALTRLKEIYGFSGGDLEKTYNSLKRDYDLSAEKVADVKRRISEMESVAADLFAEWEKEIKEISSASLKAGSRTQLRETRSRYDSLHDALKRAEQSMQPVLSRFKDQVLYLKHNLNAQAIASLKGEATNIQGEISKLISEINASIAQADSFIKALP